MLTTSQNAEARIALAPGFVWDGQDAYLFDIDGTLLRSRDRVHFDSFAAGVERVTGFEITLSGILLHGNTDTAILREACKQAGIPDKVLEDCLDAILDAMRNRVAERRGELDLTVMPGVEDVLRHLAQILPLKFTHGLLISDAARVHLRYQALQFSSHAALLLVLLN